MKKEKRAQIRWDMTRTIFWMISLALALSARGVAEPYAAIHVCVVQTNESHEYAQVVGADAKGLVQALVGETIRNGIPVIVVAVVGIPERAVNAEVEERGCEYVVEMWRHRGVDQANWSPPGSLAGGAGGAPAEAAPIGDRDMVLFAMRKANNRKVLLRGASPPPTYYGATPGMQNKTFKTPYPGFASQIVKKLDKME